MLSLISFFICVIILSINLNVIDGYHSYSKSKITINSYSKRTKIINHIFIDKLTILNATKLTKIKPSEVSKQNRIKTSLIGLWRNTFGWIILMLSNLFKNKFNRKKKVIDNEIETIDSIKKLVSIDEQENEQINDSIIMVADGGKLEQTKLIEARKFVEKKLLEIDSRERKGNVPQLVKSNFKVPVIAANIEKDIDTSVTNNPRTYSNIIINEEDNDYNSNIDEDTSMSASNNETKFIIPELISSSDEIIASINEKNDEIISYGPVDKYAVTISENPSLIVSNLMQDMVR